jgi:hypothetical protein
MHRTCCSHTLAIWHSASTFSRVMSHSSRRVASPPNSSVCDSKGKSPSHEGKATFQTYKQETDELSCTDSLSSTSIFSWPRNYRLLLNWQLNQKASSCWFLLELFLRPWRWRRYVPPKRRLQLNRLHGVTSQKMLLFITTAVKTSNPTHKK